MSISYVIIGITVVFSYLGFSNQNVFDKYKFNPFVIKRTKEWQRFVTHGFLHANWTHLLFNMLTLFFFAPNVESVFIQLFGTFLGQFYFVLLYFLAIILSSIYSYFKHINNAYYNAIGASGAVSAVLFTHIFFFPWDGKILIMMVLPMTPVVFGIVYLIYSAYMAKKGNDNIGHDSHFWGAVFGFIFPIIIKPTLFFYFINQFFLLS